MIFVKTPTKFLKVAFQHRPYKICPAGYNQVFERRATTCKIFELSDDTHEAEEKLLSMGITKCFWKDRFESEKGRIAALRLATISEDFTKEDRRIIWEAYHNRGRVSNSSGPVTPPIGIKPSKILPFSIKESDVVSKIVMHPSVLNRMQARSTYKM